MTDPELLRVAQPRECNTQQTSPEHATRPATGTQQMSLKALAEQALQRNSKRNSKRGTDQKHAQQTPSAAPSFVASVALPLERNNATAGDQSGICRCCCIWRIGPEQYVVTGPDDRPAYPGAVLICQGQPCGCGDAR